MNTELATIANVPAPVTPCTDAEAVAAFRKMGCDISLDAVTAFDSLEGWSLRKALIPVSLEQLFKSMKQIDDAVKEGERILRDEPDTESRVRGATLLTLAAKNRSALVKEIRAIARDLPPDKVQRVFKNLPPVLIHQTFNGQPAEKNAIPA